MTLTAEVMIQSINAWREEILEALESDDPVAILKHLEVKMQQSIAFIEILTANDKIIRSEEKRTEPIKGVDVNQDGVTLE